MPRAPFSHRLLKSSLKALAELCVIVELVTAALTLPLCADMAACDAPQGVVTALATWPIVF